MRSALFFEHLQLRLEHCLLLSLVSDLELLLLLHLCFHTQQPCLLFCFPSSLFFDPQTFHVFFLSLLLGFPPCSVLVNEFHYLLFLLLQSTFLLFHKYEAFLCLLLLHLPAFLLLIQHGLALLFQDTQLDCTRFMHQTHNCFGLRDDQALLLPQTGLQLLLSLAEYLDLLFIV